jgi:hypothetical protein
VSGGALSTIVLTVYGKPIHNAVATSAGLGVPVTIAGTIAISSPASRTKRCCRHSRSASFRSLGWW